MSLARDLRQRQRGGAHLSPGHHAILASGVLPCREGVLRRLRAAERREERLRRMQRRLHEDQWRHLHCAFWQREACRKPPSDVLRCVDVPAWENKAGENCYKASCSNELPLNRMLFTRRWRGSRASLPIRPAASVAAGKRRPQSHVAKHPGSWALGSPTMSAPWPWAARQWGTPYLARHSAMLWIRRNARQSLLRHWRLASCRSTA